MKVSELIQYLKLLPQNADVVSWDEGLYYTELPTKIRVIDPPLNHLEDCDVVECATGREAVLLR